MIVSQHDKDVVWFPSGAMLKENGYATQGWYFRDECGEYYGPYVSEGQALDKLAKYASDLISGY